MSPLNRAIKFLNRKSKKVTRNAKGKRVENNPVAYAAATGGLNYKNSKTRRSRRARGSR